MEEQLAHFLQGIAWPVLALIIATSLGLLGKAADWLVGYAVQLSELSGIPKLVIGATIVSLGTTTPEAVVSVLAAFQGKPGLALGNAVGSIICDTGLILGLACLLSPLRLDRKVVNRQGWIQFGCGVLLVLAALPEFSIVSAFENGGNLEQIWGVVFLLLLVLYMWQSIRWSRLGDAATLIEEESELPAPPEGSSLPRIVLQLLGAIAVVVGASWALIPAVSEAATRLSIPESVIAATMVAFGTSLPELVTAVTAARRGHGELAIGNVVGADILNVLFVAGASAAVTPGGLEAPVYFFTLYFPSMLAVLVVFRLGVLMSDKHLRRPFGAILLGTYLLVTLISYLQPH